LTSHRHPIAARSHRRNGELSGCAAIGGNWGRDYDRGCVCSRSRKRRDGDDAVCVRRCREVLEGKNNVNRAHDRRRGQKQERKNFHSPFGANVHFRLVFHNSLACGSGSSVCTRSRPAAAAARCFPRKSVRPGCAP